MIKWDKLDTLMNLPDRNELLTPELANELNGLEEEYKSLHSVWVTSLERLKQTQEDLVGTWKKVSDSVRFSLSGTDGVSLEDSIQMVRDKIKQLNNEFAYWVEQALQKIHFIYFTFQMNPVHPAVEVFMGVTPDNPRYPDLRLRDHLSVLEVLDSCLEKIGGSLEEYLKKTFVYKGIRFRPIRLFRNKAESDKAIRLMSICHDSPEGYTWDEFYKTAGEHGFAKIDLFEMMGKVVLPCGYSLMYYNEKL